MSRFDEDQALDSDLATQGIRALRTTAKWLIVALAVVAAILLAGVQLAAVGTARPLWLAFVGFGVAFASVITALWFMSEVLRPRSLSPAQLATAKDAEPLRAAIAADHTLLEGHQSIEHVVATLKERGVEARRAWAVPGATFDRTPAQVAVFYAEDALEQVQGTVGRLIDHGLFLATYRAFVRARTAMIVAALLAAAGVAAFSYATSREPVPPTETAPASAERISSPGQP